MTQAAMRAQRAFRAITYFTAVLLPCVGCACGSVYADNNGPNKPDVWWSAPEIVKKAIVSYLVARVDNKAVAAAPELSDDVMDLVLLFDAWDSSDALKTLASLSSYYAGESGGEIYSCIVIRKGHEILPYLELDMKGRGECASRFTDKQKLCVEEKWRVSRLRTLIDRINTGESCSVER